MKRMFLCVMLLLGLVGCSVGEERQARNDLETYLGHMKMGELEKAEEYVDDDIDNLIDVFAFKHLNTTEDTYTKEAGKTTIFKEDFETSSNLKKEYGSWFQYVDHLSRTYGKDENYVFEDNVTFVTYYLKEDKGEEITTYTFLYDMEIANGLGNKLYKKIEFTMEPKEKGRYLITDIHIRGSDD